MLFLLVGGDQGSGGGFHSTAPTFFFFHGQWSRVQVRKSLRPEVSSAMSDRERFLPCSSSVCMSSPCFLRIHAVFESQLLVSGQQLQISYG